MKRNLTSRLSVFGLTAALLVSCASHAPQTAQKPPPVWPSPPDEPRIAFVGNIRGPRDIGQNPSVFRTMANWVTGDTGESLNLHKPFGLALDETGNLCVTDTDANLVCYVDFAKKKWRRFNGVGKTKFQSPVAVARRNGVFYVADSQLARVFAFRDDGKPVFEIGASLKRPVGLAVSGDSLYVVDSQVHAVFVFGLDGKFQFSFGSRGLGPGEFNFPTCIAVDHDHLIVSDTMNCREQVFDLRGKYLSEFGSNGDTLGHFARPKGVAADTAGNIYVVDALFSSYEIFNSAGQLLLNVGAGGTGPGEFGLPNGIAIGSDNRIYVADAYNHRVQVFKYIGQP